MREVRWENMKDYIRSDIKDKILDIRLERQHKKNALTENLDIVNIAKLYKHCK